MSLHFFHGLSSQARLISFIEARSMTLLRPLLGRVLFVAWVCIGFCNVSLQAVEPASTQGPPGISADGLSFKVDEGFVVPYSVSVPGSDVKIEMVSVLGGKSKFGSSEDSDGHVEDEGPQIELEVAPMWAAKYETTWQEYEYFMSICESSISIQEKEGRAVTDECKVDAVTKPTPLYEPSHTYALGEEPRLPALTMTQYSGKQYTKWHSKLTWQQSRLPTEAEWDYTCRAGSDSECCFCDDEGQLEDYGWFIDDSDELPRLVGQKKPNQVGSCDMHGNMMEWVIDGYSEDGFERVAEREAIDTIAVIQWPEEAENREIRGGSFHDDPEMLRSAARHGSEDEDWKEKDPKLPLSPFGYASAQGRELGLQSLRSCQSLENANITRFWEVDYDSMAADANERLGSGKARQVAVDAELGKEFEAVK